MAITTAICNSFKMELLQGGHCFTATFTATGNVTSGNQTVVSMSSVSNISQGMLVTGTGIAANTVVANIVSNTSIQLSLPPTATNTGVTLTFAGDIFKMALISASMTGTYNANNVNYTDITGNSDETTGTGYSAGGQVLSNVTPSLSSGTAITNFSPNPSWTSASFSTAGCMIYNSSVSLGGTSGTNTTGNGRACGVFSFGGTQTVSNGTLTVLLPSPTGTTAVLRLA